MNDILCNPYFKFLVFSALFTGLVYAIPYLNKKIINTIWRYIAITIVVIAAVLIIIYLPKKKCQVAKIVQTTDSTLHNVVIHDTIIKHDPPTQFRQSIRPIKKTPQIVQNIDSGSGGIQNNAPNYAPQAGRDQYNYGIIPRKFDESEIMPLMNRYFPDRSIEIYFVAFNGADAEITAVKSQLTAIFKKNGYKNVEESFHIKIGFAPPEKVMFDSVTNQKALQIEIPPAK